jgi:hypothetical protein
MRSFYNKVWGGGRKRKFISLLALTLLTATSAFAAWQFFTGVDGSGAGRTSAATVASAVTFSPNASPAGHAIVTAEPGRNGDVGFTAHNNSAVSESVSASTLTDTITTPSAPSCAAFLSFTPSTFSSSSTLTLAPGANAQDWLPNSLVVSASAPASCQSIDVNVNIGGPSTP